jgi:hypothetical protein
MKTSAETSPFIQRLMEKPRPESMNSDPEYRIFKDVPEEIQRSLGGREWFWRMGCTRVHRVGLFKGIGWEIDLAHRAASRNPEISGVRVTIDKVRAGKAPTFTIVFLNREPAPEGDPSAPVVERIIAASVGLKLDQIKELYAETIGEHAV